MTIKNGDLPAMPIEHMDYMHIKEKSYCNGLTKREQFAAMAMQGVLSNGVDFTMHEDKDVAAAAVLYADLLLAELERTKGEVK